MSNENKVLLGVTDVNEAKGLLEKMALKGFDLEIRHNDETCKMGCRGVRVEVWANETDVPAIMQIIKQEKLELLANEGTDVDHERINQVFDTNAEQAICPACGASFSTTLKECPECGLVFIPEE